MEPPPFEAFYEYLRTTKGNSAPGPTKFRYAFLHHAPIEVARFLHYLVCICLTLQGLPPALKHALLYPIPKSAGLLDPANMRPISLLEIGHKLTTGWLAYTINLRATTAPHPLVHPPSMPAERPPPHTTPYISF
jgi:hypothetical protein